MRRVAILGSTGSIGRQALDVIAAYPERFEVCGLAANANVAALAQQVRRFRPAVVSCGSEAHRHQLAAALRGREETNGELKVAAPEKAGPEIHLAAPGVSGSTRPIEYGERGLIAVATDSGADVVLAATDGLVAFRALIAAVERGIDLALANKEVAVAAGEPLFAAARRSGARVIPVDSEHSAVLQCLQGERLEDVRTIVLTASGGPFWEASLDDLASATPEKALRHPTWRMGQKNTIDSATLMNKGLEVIEACRFFDVTPDRVDVVVHRQSVAHAFVIFCDGSVKAQLAAPDMRLPIGFALAFPDRLPQAPELAATRSALGLRGERSTLTFEPVDDARFPCLRLAYRAAQSGQTYPAVLSAANEEAGRAFLQGKIRFDQIGALVRAALDAHNGLPPTMPNIEEADRWARSFTKDAISTKA